MNVTNLKTITATSIITLTLTLISVYAYQSQVAPGMMRIVGEPCKGLVYQATKPHGFNLDEDDDISQEQATMNIFMTPENEVHNYRSKKRID